MKTTKMLKKNYEFKQVLTRGKYYSGQYIKVFIMKNNKQNNFLAQKCGKANKRNRIKRLLRENYKNLEEKLEKGYSIVFLIKKDVDTDEIDYQKIKKDMNKIFKKAEFIVLE